jgi:hypothetical protein
MDVQVIFPALERTVSPTKIEDGWSVWWDTYLRTFVQRLELHNFRLLRVVHVGFGYFLLLFRTPFDLVARLERALPCSHQTSHIVSCGWV